MSTKPATPDNPAICRHLPIKVTHWPTDLAPTPSGAYAYVTSFRDNTVSMIRTATRRVIATIGVRQGAEELRVSLDGRHVYATGSGIPTHTVESRIIVDILGMQQLGVILCTRSTADMIKLGLVRIAASLVVADPGLVLASAPPC